MEIEVKYQACNLSDSLHRNINDNFKSVSFEILDNTGKRLCFKTNNSYRRKFAITEYCLSKI